MRTAEEAARLVRRATRRRADGSRGMRARRAWRRLVRACAKGDAAVQDAVRNLTGDQAGSQPGNLTAGLVENDVLDLLAAAPDEPADHAAYLALIGQDAQRRAFDPDGLLLALAYRAAAPDVRERLRTVLAAEGDAEVIRVVVTGDQRDRTAEMSYEELDYLGHHLAEHRCWDELRRLARDLPLAMATAAARLLPGRERTGSAADVLSALAEQPSERLRTTVGRLPHDRLFAIEGWDYELASFSPDTSELAMMCNIDNVGTRVGINVDMLRIGTAEVAHLFREGSGKCLYSSILHLGDEVIAKVREVERCRMVRILPDREDIGSPAEISSLRRSSGGAVAIYRDGLAFIDRGASALRYQPIPALSNNKSAGRIFESRLATLPASRRIAFLNNNVACVVNENAEVLHEFNIMAYEGMENPGISFLSPTSLAMYCGYSRKGSMMPYTQIWQLSMENSARLVDEHYGAIKDRWPLGEWQDMSAIDDLFTARMLTSRWPWGIDRDIPWLQAEAESEPPSSRWFLTASPSRDMYVTRRTSDGGSRLEVHSPHLPSARELLERPLLQSSPQHLQRALELRTKIGDPAVRDALDLLATCLADRFGGDIALGGPAPVATGGMHDIALARDQDKQPGKPRGDA